MEVKQGLSTSLTCPLSKYRILTHKVKELSSLHFSIFLLTIRGVGYSVDSIHAMVEPLKTLFLERALNPQTIRQSVICNWLNTDKKPLDDVQLLAGHKYPSATEKYRRVDLEEQLEKIRRWHPLG